MSGLTPGGAEVTDTVQPPALPGAARSGGTARWLLGWLVGVTALVSVVMGWGAPPLSPSGVFDSGQPASAKERVKKATVQRVVMLMVLLLAWRARGEHRTKRRGRFRRS